MPFRQRGVVWWRTGESNSVYNRLQAGGRPIWLVPRDFGSRTWNRTMITALSTRRSATELCDQNWRGYPDSNWDNESGTLGDCHYPISASFVPLLLVLVFCGAYIRACNLFSPLRIGDSHSRRAMKVCRGFLSRP